MENDINKPARVVAYVRKSSEDNAKGEANKQLNSIEYQRQFVNEAKTKYNLKVERIFEDDKTGYEAFVRDGFQEMLEYLKENKGDIDGIVCTEINRLARNFADGGMILWYMQNKTFSNIYTPSKIFTNSSSDQMMVAIELTMSKKSSDEGSFRTIASMKSKALTVKHPARAAVLGYIGEGPRGRRLWIIDPITGPLVKQVFEKFATGKFTLQEIADYSYSIGLRSPSKKSATGKMSKNTLHNRLRDIQYTGVFYHGDERIAGDYEPLISPELFYSVQDVITGKGHPKDTHLTYSYSGIIRCGLCGDMLSGTNKKGITYYRCAKRKYPCKGKIYPYVTEKDLENQIIEAFKRIEIDQETWKACREYVSELNQPEKIKIKQQLRELGERIASEEKYQDDIGKKYIQGDIPKTEHDRLIKVSQCSVMSYKNTVVKCENISKELNDLMYSFLDNLKYVTQRLRIALPENKRELISIFCENLEWKDGKARWDWKKPYFILVKQPKSSTLLAKWNDFNTANWIEIIEYPETIQEQIKTYFLHQDIIT